MKSLKHFQATGHLFAPIRDKSKAQESSMGIDDSFTETSEKIEDSPDDVVGTFVETDAEAEGWLDDLELFLLKVIS